MIYKIAPASFDPKFELVSCFFEHVGKILLLHRHENKSQGGRWGMPSGKVDAGETLECAMAREIKEETGLDVLPEQLVYFDKVYVKHPEHHFVYHMFHMYLPQKPEIQVNPYEHSEFTWAKPQDALCTHLVMDLDECIRLFYKL